MKILEIDFNYFYYPEGVSCIDDFVKYLNANYNSFVELTELQTVNCHYPYFIKEDTKKHYLNVGNIDGVIEEEVTVLSRAEYEARLNEVAKKKCVTCIHYEEDEDGDNLKGHREKLTLDGECWGYEKRTD